MNFDFRTSMNAGKFIFYPCSRQSVLGVIQEGLQFGWVESIGKDWESLCDEILYGASKKTPETNLGRMGYLGINDHYVKKLNLAKASQDWLYFRSNGWVAITTFPCTEEDQIEDFDEDSVAMVVASSLSDNLINFIPKLFSACGAKYMVISGDRVFDAQKAGILPDELPSYLHGYLWMMSILPESFYPSNWKEKQLSYPGLSLTELEDGSIFQHCFYLDSVTGKYKIGLSEKEQYEIADYLNLVHPNSIPLKDG